MTISSNDSARPSAAKLLDNKATESELATIHLAGLPKNIAPDLRQTAASPIARAFSESFLVCPGCSSRLKASVSLINSARNSTETRFSLNRFEHLARDEVMLAEGRTLTRGLMCNLSVRDCGKRMARAMALEPRPPA